MKISSSSNQKIKDVVKLKQRQYRDEKGVALIDGFREVSRAYQAGWKIEEIFLCPELLMKFSGQKSLDEVRGWGLNICEVSENVFEKVAFGDRKEGVVAVIQSRAFPLNPAFLSDNPFIVVLENVEKPGNLGAILRTCDAAGVDVVIVADTRTDILNPNVTRASTGTVFSMNIMQGAGPQVRDFLREKKIRVIATTPDAQQSHFDADLKGAIAFILGAEDKGVSDFWLKEADARISIPMSGKADSLNVSTTAAILVYEALRQRNSS